MCCVEIARRKGLVGAGKKERQLNLFEECGIAQIEQVDENGCARIAERVVFGGIDQWLFLGNAFPNFRLDQGAGLFASEFSAGAVSQDALHAAGQLQAFHGADLLAPGAVEHEVSRLG